MKKRENPRIICCIRQDCNVIGDLSEKARQQSLPLNSLDLGLACWGDSENMFSFPDLLKLELIIFEHLFGIKEMKPTATINTGTLTFSHLRTRNGPFLFQKCHPLSGWSLRANDTNPGDTWLSKGAFGYA